MDWLRALNFLFRGGPDAAFTLSDHLVKVSSRHGSDLSSQIAASRLPVLLIGTPSGMLVRLDKVLWPEDGETMYSDQGKTMFPCIHSNFSQQSTLPKYPVVLNDRDQFDIDFRTGMLKQLVEYQEPSC